LQLGYDSEEVSKLWIHLVMIAKTIQTIEKVMFLNLKGMMARHLINWKNDTWPKYARDYSHFVRHLKYHDLELDSKIFSLLLKQQVITLDDVLLVLLSLASIKETNENRETLTSAISGTLDKLVEI
jgi:thiaminase